MAALFFDIGNRQMFVPGIKKYHTVIIPLQKN